MHTSLCGETWPYLFHNPQRPQCKQQAVGESVFLSAPQMASHLNYPSLAPLNGPLMPCKIAKEQNGFVWK